MIYILLILSCALLLQDKRIVAQSPILRMRAVKSSQEIEGMKNANVSKTQGNLKGESIVVAILLSRMEVIVCTSGVFHS